MEKKLVVKRLKDTLKKLKELEKAKFSYHRFVTSSRDSCGTVCCVGGWYPAWFPEARLKWEKISLYPYVDIESYKEKTVLQTLMLYHGINISLIRVLFYGREVGFLTGPAEDKKYSKRRIGLNHSIASSKKEVEELWAHVIELIETDKIIYN